MPWVRWRRGRTASRTRRSRALRERAEFGPRFGDSSTVRAAALVARAGV
ncbi:hypothetical protein J7E87_10750 [Streptomyces sp. ISL-1]|nr:hypothetical protein [Streptomyces sp. ISL-1]MBT2389890.1 hypothetical protein [Streptomyces sp. ISL-1]